MFNGARENSGNPVWERPWSTEEMRKQSSHWNLAGDAGLLQFLQDFSQRMISRTHEVEQMVNSLCHETKVTNIKVSNIVNDFHMLSNTQFVESRVYDEDVQDIVKDEKPPQKSKVERENEMVEKITNALNLGLSVMEQAFERVEIQQDSDSEDEDSSVNREVLLQPKDPYLQRPLPHLIGSKAFLDDDYVGIADFSEEEETQIEKEESDVSSEEESFPENVPNPQRIASLKDEYESESISGGSEMFQDHDIQDDLSVESSATSSDEDLDKQSKDETDKNGHLPLLAEQLEARIKQYSQKSSKKSRKGSDSQSIKSKHSIRTSSKVFPKATSDEDLFNSNLPDDEDDLFGQKAGLFSGTGKRFDESQENSGLFDEVPKPNQVAAKTDEKLLTPRNRGYTNSGKKIPAGAKLAVGVDDLFGESEHKNPSETTERKKTTPVSSKNIKSTQHVPSKNVKSTQHVAPKKQASGGLFDSDDNDDELFSTQPPRKSSLSSQASKVSKSELSKGSGSLFEDDADDENDLFGISSKKKAKVLDKKAPTGGISVFGSLAGEIGSAIKAKRQIVDSDSETEKSEDISESRDTASIKSQSSFQTKKTATKESRSNSVSSNSLFADDPEIDDLFTKKEQNSKPGKTSSILFQDGEDDEFDSLFKPKSDAKSGSFSVPKNVSSRTTSKTLSLFEDIGEDDLFSIASKPSPSSTKPATGLSLSEDETFQKPIATTVPIETKMPEVKEDLPKSKEKSVPKISLFDDNQDDDLFSVSSKLYQSPGSLDSKVTEVSKSPATSKPTIQPKLRSTSLFDDDVLFGGKNEESPEIDLFKTSETVEKPKPSTESATQAVAPISPSKKPIGGVSLFGGVDIFGGKSSLKPSDQPFKKPDVEDHLESASSNMIEKPKRPPSLKDTKEISVSFDEPVDMSNTLQSAVKDRVKVQTKRRPPSRKGRQAVVAKSGIDTTQPESDIKVDVPTPFSTPLRDSQTDKLEKEEESPVKVSSKSNVSTKPAPFLAVTADFRSPSTEEEDLFSVMDAPDNGLLSNTREKVKKLPVATKLVKDESLDVEGDLFGVGLNQPVIVETEKGTVSSITQKDVKPENMFKKCTKPPPKNQSIFGDDDDDDIFSNSSSKKDIKGKLEKSKNVSADTSQIKKVVVEDDIFADVGEDDIFKSVPSIRDKKSSKLSSQSKLIFDDDDGDIFASKSTGASSTKSISTVKQPISSGKRRESLTKKNVKHSMDDFVDPLLGGLGDSSE